MAAPTELGETGPYATRSRLRRFNMACINKPPNPSISINRHGKTRVGATMSVQLAARVCHYDLTHVRMIVKLSYSSNIQPDLGCRLGARLWHFYLTHVRMPVKISNSNRTGAKSGLCREIPWQLGKTGPHATRTFTWHAYMYLIIISTQ